MDQVILLLPFLLLGHDLLGFVRGLGLSIFFRNCVFYVLLKWKYNIFGARLVSRVVWKIDGVVGHGLFPGMITVLCIYLTES